MKKFKAQSNQGFTLIELMVSVSIFAIVTLIVSGSFITLAGIYRKVQTNRAIIDNLNLAMDTMTLQIREGQGHSINTGSIFFTEYTIEESNNTYEYTPGRDIKYELQDRDEVGVLVQCLDGALNDKCQPLTSSEIDVEELYFAEMKSSEPKLIKVVMSGVAMNKEGFESEFLLQTTLSQRNF